MRMPARPPRGGPARGGVPGLETGPRPVRLRPDQDLPLLALLAPVPRDAVHRPAQPAGLAGSGPRRCSPSGRARSRLCAKPPSSTNQGVHDVLDRCSVPCGRTRRPAPAPMPASSASARRAARIWNPTRDLRGPVGAFPGAGAHWLATGRRTTAGPARRPCRPSRRRTPSWSATTPGCNSSPTGNLSRLRGGAHSGHAGRALPRPRGRRRPGGSEIWSHPERFADKVSIGAPPDLLAPKGQNWGLPAFDPLAMERDGSPPSAPWSRPTCATPARSGSTTPSSSPGST